MKYLIITLGFFAFTFFTTQSATSGTKTTVKIKCKEMSCQGCKDKITGSINKLDGIFKVDISLKKKIITVTFDDGVTSTDKIINAILDAGYDAELSGA